MYRHVLRLSSPFRKQVCPSFQRQIFTDDYLGLHEQGTRKDSLSEELTTEPLVVKARIWASANQGLLLSPDLITMLSMAESERDLEDYKKLLVRYVELGNNNVIVMRNAGKCVKHFYKICHILRLPNAALDMFNNPVVDSSYMVISSSNLLLLDLLHKTEKHNEVVEVFNKIMNDIVKEKVHINFDLLTVVLLSLNKLGGDDAVSKATSSLHTFFSKNTMEFEKAFGRGVFAYAHLASKAGEYSLAYDAMHTCKRGKVNKLDLTIKYNIELEILTKMGRLSDAVKLLHNMTVEDDEDIGRVQNLKPAFCANIIDSLVEAVKEENDPELVEKVRATFERLDSTANIDGDDSTADIVSEDIEYFLNYPISGSSANLPSRRRIVNRSLLD